ncbi:hypothetical protein DL96DRAFT_1744509 [Flagelloscypha sp. PMI_526]|nr:hypothetical protein DL96DRAFT_1744509 [Flagelloscypha sp. PMI_526]
MSTPKLFTPIQIGPHQLNHRVMMAPMTRCRADDAAVPLPTPGTLLITEATVIARKAGGYPSVPGIYSKAQIAAWKEVTDAVHARGCFIFMQLWACGRVAYPEILQSYDPPAEYISASDIGLTDRSRPPRPITLEEMEEFKGLFVTAATNAINLAGFDGVEIHGATGYILDAFLQDITNNRTDEYGGSIENRCRFPLEVTQAVVDAVGPERTAIRISPWSFYMDMGMKDPIPTFTHFVKALHAAHPKLAYLHIIEARVSGIMDRTPVPPGTKVEPKSDKYIMEDESNEFIRDIWLPRPLLTCGGWTRAEAIELAEKGSCVSFARPFLANPDLVERLKIDAPLNPFDPTTFYLFGDGTGKGFTDYPFLNGDRA